MKRPGRFLIPSEPAVSLAFLGIMLLSAVLYYRAVNIQRFLEPALAMSKPKMEFEQNINRLITGEFGKDAAGVIFTSDAIFVRESLLFGGSGRAAERLGKVFLSALEEPEIQPYIELVMVSTRLPLSPDPQTNRLNRQARQQRADEVLDAMFAAQPGLEKYRTYFVATTVAVSGFKTQANWVEFRIVPTLRLQIDVLQKLKKYTL